MKNKLFKDIPDQRKIQSQRGLKRINESIFDEYIKQNNYFNAINGFETLFLSDKKSKIYHKNISFNDFRRVYNLDKQISKELYKQLALVELALSSSISYHLSKSYFGNFSTITSDLNTFYLDISHYSIPNQNSGPAHLINYFYNYDIQKHEVYNSHKFFKKYVQKDVFALNVDFTGTCTFHNRLGNQKLFFDGEFRGKFRGVEKNRFKGKFVVDSAQSPTLQNLSNNQQLTNFRMNGCTGDFISLSYSDYCKFKYPYIAKYEYPPIWVVINTLMLNDLIVLFLGLDSTIQNNIMKDLGFVGSPSSKKEEFINYLEVMREARNCVAHYGLISRIRTPENLILNTNLVRRLKLKPKINNSNDLKKIALFDILKVLNEVTLFDVRRIRKILLIYFLKNIIQLKWKINKNFLKRVQ